MLLKVVCSSPQINASYRAAGPHHCALVGVLYSFFLDIFSWAPTARNITYICLWGIVSVGLGVMAIISDLIPVITGVLTFDIFGLLVMISVPLVYFLAGAFAWHLYNDYREDHGKKAAQFDPFKHLAVGEIRH